MASKIQAKQIQRMLASSVLVTPITVALGATDVDITTDLATVLGTAGDNGVAVPVQNHTVGGLLPGLLVTPNHNRVDVWIAGLETKLATPTGQEVYGRLVDTAGVYTVELFFLDTLGAETAFTTTAAVDLTFAVPYVFSFDLLPFDAFGSVRQLVYQDPSAASSASGKTEVLTVSALNTLSALALPYIAGGNAELNVNGQVVHISTGCFSIAGTAVTWLPLVAGYDLDTTDSVVATYAIV